MTAITKAAAKGAEPEEDDDGPEEDKPMTFWEHLDELRKRVVRALMALVLGAVVAWTFRVEILAAICKPFQESWVGEHIAGDPSLHFATPGGVLIAYVKLSLIAGAALAAPVIFYQLWSFVAPGLYAREKKYVIPFVLCSSALFVGGGWFGYIAAFPFTFGYFFSLAGDVAGVIAIKPTVMMEEYIDFVVQMFIGFGLIFELPILLTFLGMIGVINHKKLIKFSRYYIFIAFFAAAILTPPDWTSQIVMAVPAIGLYFLSIGLVYIFQKREPAEDGADDDKKKSEKKKDKSDKKEKAQEKPAAAPAAEPKAAEPKAAEPKAAEPKAAEPKAEAKSVEPKTEAPAPAAVPSATAPAAPDPASEPKADGPTEAAEPKKPETPGDDPEKS